MQRQLHNSYANCETKILPTFRASCQTLWQTSVITGRQLQRNSLIFTTTSTFDSALEHERRKDCARLQIFARNMACFQRGFPTLAWCKKPQRNPATCSRSTWQLTLPVGQTEVEV